MQSLWGGDSPGRALATGGEGLSITAALSSLQLPNLALPKPHSPIIGEQYLGKQSGSWKEMLWVASQACQIPALSSLVCTGRAQNRCKGVVSSPSGQGGKQRVPRKVGSSRSSPRSTPALGNVHRGMCTGNRVHCRNVKQSHWTWLPLNGVLQGSDGGHSHVPENWEGTGLFCKKPRLSDAFSGEGPWKGMAEQDSALQIKPGPLPLPECRHPPLHTPGLGRVIANHV